MRNLLVASYCVSRSVPISILATRCHALTNFERREPDARRRARPVLESAEVKFPRATHLICFSRNQLDYITVTWVRHYNTERPYRSAGIDNNVLDASFRPGSLGTIRCKRQLAGIVTSYYRDAA